MKQQNVVIRVSVGLADDATEDDARKAALDHLRRVDLSVYVDYATIEEVEKPSFSRRGEQT